MLVVGLVAVAAALAVLAVVLRGGLHVHVNVNLAAARGELRAPDEPPVPTDIRRLAETESEPFARDAILAEARQLHAASDDWNQVLALLKYKYGE